jgi:hypothetical protein
MSPVYVLRVISGVFLLDIEPAKDEEKEHEEGEEKKGEGSVTSPSETEEIEPREDEDRKLQPQSSPSELQELADPSENISSSSTKTLLAVLFLTPSP